MFFLFFSIVCSLKDVPQILIFLLITFLEIKIRNDKEKKMGFIPKGFGLTAALMKNYLNSIPFCGTFVSPRM